MSDPGQSLPLRIIQDSREQNAFTFSDYPVTVEVGTLASADYSLAGFTDRIGIERKSLPDLVACLGVERERFIRELARLRGFDCAAVIVEQPQAALRLGHYRGHLNPASAWQTILAFTQRYRIPFIFCDSRADAEQVTFDILRHFHRDRARELEALRTPARIAPAAPVASRPRVGTDRSRNASQSRTEAANRTPPLSHDAETTPDPESMGPFRAGGGSRSRAECGVSLCESLKTGMRG